jgi:hypothetical protein
LLAKLPINGRNGYGLRSTVENKGPRKALQTVLVCGVLLLVGRRDRAAIGVMLAKLGECSFVESGRLRKLASHDRQQQRLHDQGIDCDRADQPPPEHAEFRASLI